MARCTICWSGTAKLNQVDSALLQGELLVHIAKKFKLSVHALGRHKRHMRDALSLAASKAPNRSQDVAYGNGLLNQLAAIENDVLAVQQQAEAAKDLRVVLAATKQRGELLELRARLTGDLQTGDRNLTIVAPITDKQALEMAQDFIKLFGNGADAQDGPLALQEPPGSAPPSPDGQGDQRA
jgi:hypothetical protein